MQHNIDPLSYTINCSLRQLKRTDLRIALTFHYVQVPTSLKKSSFKMLGMGGFCLQLDKNEEFWVDFLFYFLFLACSRD